MASADDVTFIIAALGDPTLTGALGALVSPAHIDAARHELSDARRWKRRRKVTIAHGRWTGGYVRTFAAAVPATAGGATVWARVACDDDGPLWVRFFPHDPATDVRLRVPAPTMAKLSRITDVEFLADHEPGPDGAVRGPGFCLVDPWQTDERPEQLPVDLLVAHRAALVSLWDPREDFVWGGLGRAVADVIADRVPEGPFTGATLAQMRQWWGWVPGLEPALPVPAGQAEPDVAGRYLDTWLAPVADAHYIPHLHGTAYGLEVSTWMFGDREHTTIVFGRDPGTGAIGAAYTTLV